MTIQLDDKYTARSGRVFLSGTQALVRLPMVQMWRDRAAGLNTATYISGYRGSPLGGYDQQLERARKFHDPLDIRFQPGLNEELAATAIWGTQQLYQSPGANRDGVLGIWYGKGPGVDRCGDVFKHANAFGTTPHGGVLALAGDDHGCKSSTIPHQSDHAFAAALIPMVYPSTVQEFTELGLFAIAMSRFSGCWSAMKVIADTVETSAVIDLAGEARQFILPQLDLPREGLHNRWPDVPLVQDKRLVDIKGYAAREFAHANGIDITVQRPKGARLGIVASGKAFEDTRQALRELELGPEEMETLGIALYKVRMPWPLEPKGLRAFATGLTEMLIIEERREMIENQAKEQLYNWDVADRPRITGKFDDQGARLFSHSDVLTAAKAALVIADRLLLLDMPEGLRAHLNTKRARIEAHKRGNSGPAPVVRKPFFCAGCPHNSSTRVPEGSRASAGIGCHYMVTWMDRRTEGFTQMGGEGCLWHGQAPFTDEAHQFVNLGDGTYFHSGLLAVRASVAAKVNITYKVLYNDAVAMTGGQPHDGTLAPDLITRQLHAEGVGPIYLVSDAPEAWQSGLAPGVIVRHRDEMDQIMTTIRDEKGVSAIVFVQTCAAEKRRRRKRGLMEDPPLRLFINEEICEGCGDCSEKSNCVAIEPSETPFGRKRVVNQSACNKDYSCLKGFCPSFVSVHGGAPRKDKGLGAPQIDGLPEPDIAPLTQPVNIAVTGVGGTGVLTIGAILGMAAHVDGKASMLLDMAGLAQKGGAVLSHVRIGATLDEVAAPRIAAGTADLLIAADSVVAASPEGFGLCDIERTCGIVNGALTPVADFVTNRNFDFREQAVMTRLKEALRDDSCFADFADLARKAAGDTIATNIMMVGFALQKGLLPLSRNAVEQAIRLNGVAVEANLAALGWGRVFAADADQMNALAPTPAPKPAEEDLTARVGRWEARLAAYQSKRFAKRYAKKVAAVAEKDRDLALIFAENYARLLYIKDEYEVARLLTAPQFEADLEAKFEGTQKITYHLAPPILPGTDANGQPKKREFGPWFRPVLRLLARGKRLRGTPLDPFTYHAERKAEKALPGWYERMTTMLLERDGGDQAVRAALFDLPAEIRGYGPVKMAAIDAAKQREASLLAALDAPEQRLAAQ